jgi:hypothetical protein
LAWKEGMKDWEPLNTIIQLDTSSADNSTSQLQPLSISGPAQKVRSTAAKRDEPKGIGGWLLLWCVILTIIFPVVGFSSIWVQWEEYQRAFEIIPSLEDALYFENLGSASFLIYGFFVGCIIWSGSSNGLQVAKIYLIAKVVGFFVIAFITLSILGEVPLETKSATTEGMFIATVKELAFFFLWWFYFKKSKRVKNTYL